MDKKERKNIINEALKRIKIAIKKDEVPVSAVIFNSQNGSILVSEYNKVETQKDVTSHAEILAIKKASKKIKSKFLKGYSMFVTLEPCSMCASAISLSRLDAVYYAVSDPKTGGVRKGARIFKRTQTHYKPKNKLLNIKHFGEILTNFFQAKRKFKKNTKIVDKKNIIC